MSVWIAFEGLLCLAAYFLREKLGFLGYQVAIASVYLVTLCFELTLDYTMSVYFVFAVAPYLKYFRLPTAWEFLLALYLGASALIGIMNNGFVAVISMLVIHYLGPLCLIYIYCNIPKCDLFPKSITSPLTLHGYIEKMLIACMLAEAVIGIIAIAVSSDGRLMLNYQCVSGCVACICIILLAFQLNDKYHVIFGYLCMAYCVGWAFLSGTRGYIVLAVSMALTVVATQNDNRNKVLIACTIGVVLCLFLLLNADFYSEIISGSRMTESIGRRTYENRWFLNLFTSQGVAKDALGIGIGTKFSSQEGAVAAFYGTGVDDYAYRVIMGNTTLHNFWYTMTLGMGLAGTFLYVAVFVRFAHSCLCAQIHSRNAAFLLVMFLAVYAFVLWYRWTATGGILESAVLETFLGLYQFSIDQKSNSFNSKTINHTSNEQLSSGSISL